MTNGYIFSAGKETRYSSLVPKALARINGVSLLDHNISVMSSICDGDIYVVVSKDNKCFFNGYNVIEIDSGKGCGDAVMKAISFNDRENCMISWGDCILDYRVVSETYTHFMFYKQKNCKVVIPCSYEDRPYVRLEQDKNNKIKVEFSKYGEVNQPGLHDYGFFIANSSSLLLELKEFQRKIMVGDEYRHKHGNEMQFLDVFNETDLTGEIIQIDYCKPKSFNTKDELNELRL